MKAELLVREAEILRGKDYKVILTVPPQNKGEIATLQALIDKVKDKPLTATIAQHQAKRTLEANKYMWVLLDKIAKVLESDKEEIYRETVSRVGVFDIFPVKDIAVEDFIKRWNAQGMAYLAERLDNSKLQGYIKVICYYGSSCYTRAEMARLINEIITQAKELGIETITPAEKERMLKMIKE